MSGALAEGEYKIDCNHQLDRWLQNMPHHLRRWLGYGRQRGQNTDRRPLEANSTESLPLREVSRGRRPPGASFSAPSREVSRGRRPPGASSSGEVSRSQAPPRATSARTSREVSRGRAPPRASSSMMPREVSRGRVPPRASHSKMSQEVSGGRAPPRAFSLSSSVAGQKTRAHYSRTPGPKSGESSRETYKNMFRDIREQPASDVTAPPSVAQLADQMKAMQGVIAALSKQQTPQAAPLAPPTSQPTPLAAPMPPPAPLTPQPVTPAPQPTLPTPPVPVLGPTEMMVLGSDILDVVKQLDLAAVEEVETLGTSWEEMVAAEEPNCQAVEDMLLGDSNEDAPSAASQ